MASAREDYMMDVIQRLGAQESDLDFVWASVEYRLAPETPWPGAVDDSLRALAFLLTDEDAAKTQGYDSRRVLVGGVSAGGYLAVVTVLQAAKLGLRVSALFADEPMIWTPLSKRHEAPSWKENAFSRILPPCSIDAFWFFYLGAGSGSAVCSLTAEEQLPCDGPMMGAMDVEQWRRVRPYLPPRALVLVGSADPLRDMGMDFARIYAAAGGDIRVVTASASHALILASDANAAGNVTMWLAGQLKMR